MVFEKKKKKIEKKPERLRVCFAFQTNIIII